MSLQSQYEFEQEANHQAESDDRESAFLWLVETLRVDLEFVGEALGEAHEAITAAAMLQSPIELYAAMEEAIRSYAAMKLAANENDVQKTVRQWRNWSLPTAVVA